MVSFLRLFPFLHCLPATFLLKRPQDTEEQKIESQSGYYYCLLQASHKITKVNSSDLFPYVNYY